MAGRERVVLMAKVNGNEIILDYKSPVDAVILAKALRESVFDGLTVKQFHASEAVDVLRLLRATVVNDGTFNVEDGSYDHGGQQ